MLAHFPSEDDLLEYEIDGVSMLLINNDEDSLNFTQPVTLTAMIVLCATLCIVIIYILIRRVIFYLAWQSFRDGPYTLGYHQWRPAKLTGYAPLRLYLISRFFTISFLDHIGAIFVKVLSMGSGVMSSHAIFVECLPMRNVPPQ